MSQPTPPPLPSAQPLDDVMATHRDQHAAERKRTQPNADAIAALPPGGHRPAPSKTPNSHGLKHVPAKP
jgi:hypothetical protein